MADKNEVLTLTQIKKLKVAELRERLQSLGLPTNGLKPDLVNRLLEAFNTVRTHPSNDEVIGEQSFPGANDPGLTAFPRTDGSYIENSYNQQYQQPTNTYPFVPSFRETSTSQYIPTEHMQYVSPEPQYPSTMSYYQQPPPAFNQLGEQLVPESYQSPMEVGPYSTNTAIAPNIMVTNEMRSTLQEPSASMNVYCQQRDNFRKEITSNESEGKQNQELLNFDDVAFGAESCEQFSQQSFESLVESANPHQQTNETNAIPNPIILSDANYTEPQMSQVIPEPLQKKKENVILQEYITRNSEETKLRDSFNLVQTLESHNEARELNERDLSLEERDRIEEKNVKSEIEPSTLEANENNTDKSIISQPPINMSVQQTPVQHDETGHVNIAEVACESNDQANQEVGNIYSAENDSYCLEEIKHDKENEANNDAEGCEKFEETPLKHVSMSTNNVNISKIPTDKAVTSTSESANNTTLNQNDNGKSDEMTECVTKVKLTKNQKKKLRTKRKRERKTVEKKLKGIVDDDKMDIDDEQEEDVVEIEYVPDQLSKDPIYFQFLKVFDKFRTGESRNYDLREEEAFDPIKKMLERKKPVELELKDEEDKKDGEQKLSKRKLKQLMRMTVADLKQRVTHPELVEMHDVTAKDPILLLHLKATRNSVPVPRHWCYKRKYLQGKRGYEKPAFKLPEFIRKTGIMEMRQALADKEDSKSLKTKMREKIRPKMGKIDIDYQKLHDAFFKWQTKPKVTIHGDLYYEGKEFETRLKEKKPGDLSNELRVALGMPTGPNAHKCPPPWLIAMQRYGPPPSYPNLKIPGLNAPIPDGCSFGYHAGGWGKPPVDEYGRPLYGDVFGVSHTHDHLNADEEVDRSLWGEMESEDEEDEEEDDEEEEISAPIGTGKLPVIGKEPDESGLMTPTEGLITPSGISSIPTGMETPDIIELRKRKIEAEMESTENPQLFSVLPERKTERVGKEVMGSTHVYDISGSGMRKGQGIEVALDPNELEMDSSAMTAKYEQTLKEQQQSHIEKEDLSDMVAEHVARQKKKKQQDNTKSSKKYKDFKF